MTKEAPIPDREREATQTYGTLIRHLGFVIDSSSGIRVSSFSQLSHSHTASWARCRSFLSPVSLMPPMGCDGPYLDYTRLYSFSSRNYRESSLRRRRLSEYAPGATPGTDRPRSGRPAGAAPPGPRHPWRSGVPARSSRLPLSHRRAWSLRSRLEAWGLRREVVRRTSSLAPYASSLPFWAVRQKERAEQVHGPVRLVPLWLSSPAEATR